MSKLKDSISSIAELDELTEYLLDKRNEDCVVSYGNGVVETEKLIVSFSKSIFKAVEERVMDILNGELEWVEPIEEGTDTFEFKPLKILTVEGIQVNLY